MRHRAPVVPSRLLVVLLGLTPLACPEGEDGPGSSPEVREALCDGQDNNGNGEIDEGFDADGDGDPDCVDIQILAGVCDEFANGAEPAYPSETLQALALSNTERPSMNFDDVPGEGEVHSDSALGHTFADLPPGICSGWLERVMRPTTHSSGSLGHTDGIALQMNGCASFQWYRHVDELAEANGVWNQSGPITTFALDLAALPSQSGPQSLLSAMESTRALDFYVADDSGVDCLVLHLDTGCLSTPEVCDGIDNDGDGQTDEGYPDTDLDGIANCQDSEICDGMDNDGDCLIDELFPDTDHDGIADCVDEEECDHLDNDGDGIIDEGCE